jgi:hypothetical protein
LRWALFDLSINSPGFDIFTFIQYAHNRKAEGIWFKPGYRGNTHFGDRIGERMRMKTIVVPAVEMHGFHWEMGDEVPGELVWPVKDPNRNPNKPPNISRAAHTLKWLSEIRELRKLKIPQDSLDRVNDKFNGRRPVVVVTRNVGYDEYRNSSPDWMRWASDHDAEVIADYSELNKISLADRLAHYELASMSFGVTSGNMTPNIYSDRPYLSIATGRDAHLLKRSGMTEPYQFPWANKTQKLAWNTDDDYEAIEREFSIYQEENGSRLSKR